MKSYEYDDLKKIKYIYFPLHKEPELMLNLKAPLWHDSSHAIKYISSMLPLGYKLIVREHIKNWGRRYTRYYRFLSRLPGVILVDPFDSQFKYIENADLVITENGSTGWEALLLKKPVITLDKTFYDVANLAIKATIPSGLDKYIMKALNGYNKYNSEEYDRRLGLFLDAEKENSLSMESKAVDHLQMIEKLLNEEFTHKENCILEEY
jgi:CDP-glycerol glycerophosphotransferase (TagB/SpsB family)